MLFRSSGRVALTIHRLPRHDGWRLQRRVGAAWVAVDQSVAGNDWWQAAFDADDASWSLTFNVANVGATDYRLVWQRPAASP